MTSENHSKSHLDLLSLGEALVDFISAVEASSLEEAAAYERYRGGQPTNLAANMTLLGRRAAVVACLGDDGLGHFVSRQLAECGVVGEFIQFTSQAPTSMAIITRHAGTADFMIHRGADALLQASPALEEAAANSRIVHASAFGLSREPARTTILDALRKAREAGRIVSLDPNFHPKIWPDTPDFVTMLRSAFQYVNVSKPSLDDCRRLFGDGRHPVEYIRLFLDWGCQIVILTMGAQGILVATASGDMVHFKGNAVSVVDATGAGDAFWSGFLNSFLDDSSVIRAAQMGQAIAELKLGQAGPLHQFPPHEELLSRAASVHYREL
jgi:fructokinase